MIYIYIYMRRGRRDPFRAPMKARWTERRALTRAAHTLPQVVPTKQRLSKIRHHLPSRAGRNCVAHSQFDASSQPPCAVRAEHGKLGWLAEGYRGPPRGGGWLGPQGNVYARRIRDVCCVRECRAGAEQEQNRSSAEQGKPEKTAKKQSPVLGPCCMRTACRLLNPVSQTSHRKHRKHRKHRIANMH